MSFYAIMMISAALLIVVRTTCLASQLSAKNWNGHKSRFTAMAASHSLLAAGALGVVLGWHHGAMLLLMGAALKLVSDKRRNGGER